MGRTLKILIVAAIMVIAVAPIWAQVNLSGAISVTEWAEAAGISSRINAKRNGRPIGGTSTKMGLQTGLIAHPWMSYHASLSTVGIDANRIKNADYTPDGGKTIWVPEFVDGKGYTLKLPLGNTKMKTRCKVLQPKKNPRDKDVWKEGVTDIDVPGLPIGEMSSGEWILTVHDKKNRIIIVIVPVTWTSDRRLAMGSDIMVQQALSDFDCLPDTLEGDRKAYTYLRGFIPAWGMPDPSAIAAMEYQNSLAQANKSVAVNQSEATKSKDSGSDGTIRAEVTVPVQATPKPVYMKLKIHLWPLGAAKPVTWDATVDQSWYNALTQDVQCVKLTRSGKEIAIGEAQAARGMIEIHLTSKTMPETGDKIETIEEVN